jgi:hypothetical protein
MHAQQPSAQLGRDLAFLADRLDAAGSGGRDARAGGGLCGGGQGARRLVAIEGEDGGDGEQGRHQRD